VDAFTFSHELDWLDIRLNEFKEHVDYYVIMEGNTTFTGKPKMMYYVENKSQFADFEKQIIHVNCTQDPIAERFVVEVKSRECLAMGVKDLQKKLQEIAEKTGVSYGPTEVVILASDLDELPRTELIRRLKWYDPLPPTPSVVMHSFYYYNFHWEQDITTRHGSRVITLQDFLASPRAQWHAGGHDYDYMKKKFLDAGWHCSSCLTPEALKYKLQTFSHTEFNKPEVVDLDNLNRSIETGKDFAFRYQLGMHPTTRLGDIPPYILRSMDKYPYLIPLSKYSKETILQAALSYITKEWKFSMTQFTS
jgi:beta-1,4-mannosyl-glycoprotein beta-1,4-N-acetylglucosaminyltransferase